MKPEQLKGKWVIEQGDVYQIYGENMDKQELVNQDCQDLFEDIQEAVEWLKENISGETITIQNIRKQIDEAFRDVVSDVSKASPSKTFEDVSKEKKQ